MTRNDFYQEVKKFSEQTFPGSHITMGDVERLDGSKTYGICVIPKERKAGSTIDLNLLFDAFQEGHDWKKVLVEVISQRTPAEEAIDTVEGDYDDIRDRMMPRLVNYEFVSNHPQMVWMPITFLKDGTPDIVMVGEIRIDKQEGPIAFKFTHITCGGNLNIWGVSREKIFEDALINLHQESLVMEDITESVHKTFPNISGEVMYISSSDSEHPTARVVLKPSLRSMLQNKFPDGCYLVPQSIYGFLAVSNQEDLAYLRQMLADSNEKQEDRYNVLSHEIYTLDDDGHLVVAE